MQDSTGYYEVALHPGQINIYYKSLCRHGTRPGLPRYFDGSQGAPEPVPVNLIDRSHKGRISIIANRKISRAVQYMTYLVPKKRHYHTPDGKSGNYFLNFITLTLSSKQIHSDNEIKSSILEPFLNELRKRYKVSCYIWRAERQENGNVHFHILSDRFIWWNDLRNSWNYFQERLGYVSRYRLSMREYFSQGFRLSENLHDKRSVTKQRSAYDAGVRSDWNSPNSTDVHSLRDVVNVRSYVTKYITKPDEHACIEGRLWGCSYNLTHLSGSIEFLDGQVHDEIDKLSNSDQVRIYKKDFCTVLYFPPEVLVTLHLLIIISLIRHYCKGRFPDHFPPDLFQ